MSLNGGYAMRTFDLAPLYRSTVGFDRLFSMLDEMAGFEGSAPGYPPYNIERTGENEYRITVAVAGFSQDELSIEAKENTLTIRGEKSQKQEERKGEVLHQGIAARAFERAFQLADLGERASARRPRARDPGGQEAAPDCHQHRQGGRGQSRGEARRLTQACDNDWRRERPGHGRGAFAL